MQTEFILRDALNWLGDDVESKINCLNYGGCCVFAGMVATALENKGYPVQGRVAAYSASRGTANIHNARRHVKKNSVGEWNIQGIHFGHVGLEVYDGQDIYLYDSNGCRDPIELLDGMHSYEGRLTAKEMTELWLYNGPARGYDISWNPEFNRTQIPKLYKIIQSHFRKIPAAY
jgi:hypothetical protein